MDIYARSKTIKLQFLNEGTIESNRDSQPVIQLVSLVHGFMYHVYLLKSDWSIILPNNDNSFASAFIQFRSISACADTAATCHCCQPHFELLVVLRNLTRQLSTGQASRCNRIQVVHV